MSLLDLKSDLSKYRAETSIEEKEGPQTSVAKSSKGFATNQPITDRLLTSIPEIKKPKQTPIDERLKKSKLDDIVRKDFDDMMLNSVSGLSPKNIDVDTYSLGRSTIENVTSKFGEIKQEEIVNNLNSSNTLIIKTERGTNNNQSGINPEIFKQTVDRIQQTPNILTDNNEETNNIIIPEIKIDGKPLTINREKQSVVINKNLFSPINNVVNPNIALNTVFKPSNKENTTPNIIKDTIKEGLVTDPKTKVFRIQSGTNHFTDESELNPKGKTIEFVSNSMLESRRPIQEPDLLRYSRETIQDKDNSIYNVDDVIKTNPSGRNENPTKSLYSFNNPTGVNNFDDRFFRGFSINQKSTDLVNKFSSIFGWPGIKKTAPSVDFIIDEHAKGFKTFAQPRETLYNTDTSDYSFVTVRNVNFFDVTNQHTNAGFTLFASALTSNYIDNISRFTWKGKKPLAPNVNYFDFNKEKSNAGFHTFAQIYDTKYINQSSIYDWDGKRTKSPEVNFFDINSTYTKKGFHKLADIYDSKYVRGASIFDWDGKRKNAPAVNYFDVDLKNATTGFHVFAQKYDSKFVKDSSEFDWDGIGVNAPAINYFDINGRFTSTGFHTFAQIYDTKYIPERSRFDWNGERRKAPAVNYFDLSKDFTTTGFHTFARKYDSKYIPERSFFDWDGTRDKAPAVNYFDLYAENTTTGFHTFAQLYDTKFIEETSRFDWDGNRIDAPTVNYFDVAGTNRTTSEFPSGFVPKTTAGFHKFAQIYDTKYVRGSSIYDWDGDKQVAPAVNYFDVAGTSRTATEQNSLLAQFNVPRSFIANTIGGFHTFPQKYDTKYITESSEYNWDGSRDKAPVVNYFDIAQTNRTTSEFTNGFISFTTAGFHKFAQLYDTKYIRNSSRYDWDGKPDRKNFTNPIPVDYFDNPNANARRFGTQFIINTPNDYRDGIMTVGIKDKFIAKTFGGFHIFAQLYDSKYIPESSRFDWDGTKYKAPAVDYFDTAKTNRTTSELNSILINPNIPRQFYATTTAGFHIFAQKYDTKYIKYASLYDWDGVPDKTNFRNPIPVDYFDTLESNRTTSEANSLLAAFNRPKDFIAKTTAGFHIFAQKYDTKYIKDSSLYDWDGRADRTNFTNPIGVDFFDAFRSINRYRARFNVGDNNFLDNPGTTQNYEAYNLRSPIGGFSFLKTIGTKDAYIKKTLSGFDIFAEHYISKYIPGASRFDWDGTRDKAPAVDYFDSARGRDAFIRFNLGGGDYLRGIQVMASKYPAFTTVGGVQRRFDFKIEGVTYAGFHTFAQKYDTQYIMNTDQYGWVGNVDRLTFKNPLPVNFFDNPSMRMVEGLGSSSDNIDGNSKPGTTNATPVVINGQLNNNSSQINPGSILHQLGMVGNKDPYIHKTTAGFHILAKIYDSKYVPDSSIFDYDGTKLNAPAVNYFDKNNLFTRSGFHTFALGLDSKYIEDSSYFDWNGIRTNAPAVTFFPQIEPKTDHARKIVLFSIQNSPNVQIGRAGVNPPELFRKEGLDPGFRTFFINKTQTAYSPYLSELSVLATADPYTDFFPAPNGFSYPTDFDKSGRDPGRLGNASGLVQGIRGFVPFLGTLNRPTFDQNEQNLQTTRFLLRLMNRLGVGNQYYDSTLGSKYSFTDAKQKYTRFFSFFSNTTKSIRPGNTYPFKQSDGFLPFMTLFYGTKYPIIMPTIENYSEILRANNVNSDQRFVREALVSQVVYSVAHGHKQGTLSTLDNGSEQEFLNTYLPDSLGKRPWSSKMGNLLFATMANQYPQYTSDKTNRFYGYRRPTTYFTDLQGDNANSQKFIGGPYEQQLKNGWWAQPIDNDEAALKNITNDGSGGRYENITNQIGFSVQDDSSANLVRRYGFLGRWAIKSGALEKEYNKFDLRKDSYNPDLIWDQPYYTSNIGANWGWGVLSCGRNSPSTLLDRSLADLQRIGKWMTSGKGLLWIVKQFGLQFMNPYMDSWNEPFDVFQTRSSTDSGPNRQTYTLGNSVLPGFGDGSSNPDQVRSTDPNIFMPSPTMLYNPFSTIISAVGKGIGLHWQRHWGSTGFGFNGVMQQPPNYRELLFTTQYSVAAGQGDPVSTTDANNNLAYRPTLGNITGNPNQRQNVPQDLNRGYEAQTTYRNKTGFIDQNIAGINYLKRSFHRRLNGDWMIPAEENPNWNAVRADHDLDMDSSISGRQSAGNQLSQGTAEALDYFEEPTRRNAITRQRRYNRLIGLMKELLPQSFAPILLRAPNVETQGFDNSMEYDVAGGGFDFSDISTQYSGPAQSANTTATYTNPGNPVTVPQSVDPISELRVKSSNSLKSTHRQRLTDGEIIRISSTFGGASSFLGIGGTVISKSRHKLIGTYSTHGPELTQDGILEGKQRETFFAIDFYSTYKDRLLKVQNALRSTSTVPQNELGGDLYAITTGLATKNKDRLNGIFDVHGIYEPNDPQHPFRGENVTIQPITTRKINAMDTFNFPYESSQNRLRNTTVQEITSGRGSANTTMDTINANINNIAIDNVKHFKTSPWYSKNRFGSTSPASSRPPIPATRINPGVNYFNPSWTPNRSEKWNDFRWDIDDFDATNVGAASPRNTTVWPTVMAFKFSTHPAVVDYDQNNLETKFGLGKHGDPGSDRGNPRVTNIIYEKVQTAIMGPLFTPALVAGATGRGVAFRTFPVPIVKAAAAGAPPYQFRGDRINIIDYKRANVALNHELVYEKGAFDNINNPGKDDLIEFYFSSIVLDGHNYCPAEVIVFRAIFDSITDNHKPSWSAVKYMGRGDPLYTYDGYERDVSFNFTVHIGSRDEAKASWRKLNYLAGWTAPEYTSAGFIRAPLCRLNIGNLFRKMPGYISNLSYTFDNANGTWETAHLEGDRYNVATDASIVAESAPGALQLPKTIQVSVGFVPIGVYRPERYGVFYPLYDDRMGGGSIETGLIPDASMGTPRVNWFNPFDNIAMPGPAANPTATATSTTIAGGDQDAIEYMAVAPGEEGAIPAAALTATGAP